MRDMGKEGDRMNWRFDCRASERRSEVTKKTL